MKKLSFSVLVSVVLAIILAFSASAVMFTDVDSYASFEMGGDPCYIMDDYADVADYYAGAWDSAGDNGDELTTAIVDGAGVAGSKAIGVSSSGTSNAGLYLYATAKNGITKGFDGQTYLRVWCDFTNVGFRKANFGVVTMENNMASLFTADEPNADGGEGFQSFYYTADGTNWEEMVHGGDGCFGDAQDSDVYGLKGYFAFPLDSFFVRSNCNSNEVEGGSTPIAADIVGVYLFWDYSDERSDTQGNTFYLDNIEFVTDYKAFDAPAAAATPAAAEAPAADAPAVINVVPAAQTFDFGAIAAVAAIISAAGYAVSKKH